MELKPLTKSVKKSVENVVGFWIGFGWVFDGFWGCAGDPGPSKMSVSSGRGAIFWKFIFFRPEAILDRFMHDV